MRLCTHFSSVQSLSHVWLCNSMDGSRPGFPVLNSQVCSSSCPLSWWCHPTVSSSVIPFSSCPQSFPASGSFQMSQLFVSGGQSIGASASASVFPINIQDWFPLGDRLDLLAVQETLKSLLQCHSSKASNTLSFFTLCLIYPNVIWWRLSMYIILRII